MSIVSKGSRAGVLAGIVLLTACGGGGETQVSLTDPDWRSMATTSK